MAAIEALPDNVSANDAIRHVSDAEYAARLGLAPKTPEATPEPEVERTEVTPEKPAAEVAETPVAEGTEPETVEPEAPVDEPAKEPEKEPEPKQYVTKFEVLDPEGEVEIPDLYFNFKANKKELKNVPLDKMVLLAQQGVYNHERQLEVQQREEQAQAALAQAEEAKQAADNYEQYYSKLFEDPEFYERARTKYYESKSPEAEAARLRQELADRDRREVSKQVGTQRAQMVEQVLVPHMQTLLAQNPTVNINELLGQWNMLTAPVLVRGEVPVERLATVRSLAEHELTQWVQSLHLERTAEAANREKQLKAAKREATTAKRQVARATAPTGAQGVPQQKPKELVSAQDWFKDRFGG